MCAALREGGGSSELCPSGQRARHGHPGPAAGPEGRTVSTLGFGQQGLKSEFFTPDSPQRGSARKRRVLPD